MLLLEDYDIMSSLRRGALQLWYQSQMVNTRTDANFSTAVQNSLQTLLPQIRAEIREEFRTSSGPSTLNHLMCMSYTDVAQVTNATRNYKILHERDDDDTERPDKRQKSGSSGLRRFFRYAMLSIHSIYVMSLYPFTERYAQPYFFSCFIRQVTKDGFGAKE
nr:hypothetical protein [Tanacetum cinerariifolium]